MDKGSVEKFGKVGLLLEIVKFGDISLSSAFPNFFDDGLECI